MWQNEKDLPILSVGVSALESSFGNRKHAFNKRGQRRRISVYHSYGNIAKIDSAEICMELLQAHDGQKL